MSTDGEFIGDCTCVILGKSTLKPKRIPSGTLLKRLRRELGLGFFCARGQRWAPWRDDPHPEQLVQSCSVGLMLAIPCLLGSAVDDGLVVELPAKTDSTCWKALICWDGLVKGAKGFGMFVGAVRLFRGEWGRVLG
ncbi:hypothetical protein BDN67DRAFT_985712 [Paxillus ammoniavirescens]|nr:hypothetical protein BDN67DRAFT_985712 [Paxillus ammoniavirescens]